MKGILKIKGPKGELNRTIPSDVQLDITDDKILVKRSSDVNKVKALHGLTRSLINNMIIGVTDGFEKALEIKGTGYKCDIKSKNELILNLDILILLILYCLMELRQRLKIKAPY